MTLKNPLKSQAEIKVSEIGSTLEYMNKLSYANK